MFKRSALYQSMLLALVLPGAALAEVEFSGYIKNETAVFTKDGQVTGEARTMLDEDGHGKGDLMKFENSARIFINGDLGEESSWHADLNIVYDPKAVNDDYKGHELYSQNDYLRELYADTGAFGWDLRLGKQQVVWGTADGIKLLDIINPTDFREMNQNATEDARIPIWMINAERNVGENGNIQLIVSQVQENKIPGLNRDGDAGHPFVMKGVDSITGRVNGFLDVTPALARVAQSFNNAALAGMFSGNQNSSGLVPFAGLTVDAFASNPNVFAFDCPPTGCDGTQGATLLGPGDIVLNDIAQFGLDAGDPNGNNLVTNVMDIDGPSAADVSWAPSAPKSAFEYMPNATFATFNTFAGSELSDNSAGAVYERDYPEDANANFGTRYTGSTDGGLNFSVNYFYHYDANPYIDLSWRDAVTKETLTVQRAESVFIGSDLQGNPLFAADVGTNLSADQVPNDVVVDTSGGTPTTNSVSMLLHDSAANPNYYGAVNPDFLQAVQHTTNPVEMVMTEKLNRIHSLGSSFDYALDTDVLGSIIFRGEFLYNKDEMQPIVDKRLMGVGDLTSALTMKESDTFKYVLGADITIFTNLLMSGQFIQFRNLDYVDEKRSCTTQATQDSLTGDSIPGKDFDCSRYTADFSTLSMGNGLNEGYENKEFYSLFFSKPFGDAQEHRWNNITIYEEGGGWWNRFDVEYSFTDSLLGSAEWNHYTGDEDTTFGQFDKSSNLQVGMKLIF